ncbi:MAG: DUF3108 domain-containing protein [Pseudobdellovibrio sp.]
MRILLLVLFLVGCSSNFLKYDKNDKFFKNEEFDRQVQIKTSDDESSDISDSKEAAKEIKEDTSKSVTLSQSSESSSPVVVKQPVKKHISKVKPTKVKPVSIAITQKNSSTAQSNATKKLPTTVSKTMEVSPAATITETSRQPDIEDKAGFPQGSRRPAIDPFKIGEKVVHSVTYFGAEAGKLTMQVKPMAEVNGKKSYHFAVSLKSSSIFSKFYSVDDQMDTFLDYEMLVPYVLKLNIKETGKLAQSQAYFNHTNNTASFWEKKYTEKSGEEEKKYSWDILPYSQNAFSGIFYMRVFDWKVGKEISFRVAEDKKNVVFKGTAIAKEKLSTDAGTFDAYKIKASIISRGALSQTGDIFIWVTADEHKYIVRIEAKIKIGTLVSEVEQITPGK